MRVLAGRIVAIIANVIYMYNNYYVWPTYMCVKWCCQNYYYICTCTCTRNTQH